MGTDTPDGTIFEQLRGVPVLADLGEDDVAKMRPRCRVLRIEAETPVFREGEYGFEIYVVIGGSVRVVKTSRERGDQVLAMLGKGAFFGEMGPMVGQARSATVITAEPSVLVEVTHEGFEELLEVPSFKGYVDQAYMERALAGYLGVIPLFREVPPETLAGLADRARLQTFGRGDVVVREGDEGDAFYLIRRGFVKVTRRRGEGEKDRVLAYLRENGWFGEMALIEQSPRSATVTAIGNVEVVRIDRADFERLLAENPEVRRALDERMARLRADEAASEEGGERDETLDLLVEKGLIQVDEVLAIDLATCVRCGNCERNCAVTHEGWSRIVRKGFRMRGVLLPASCYTCPDPECMKGCRFGVIQREPDGAIGFRDHCTGCTGCARACPYGVITMAEVEGGAGEDAGPTGPRKGAAAGGGPARRPKRVAVKCDMCRGLGFTACTANCPTGAIQRVDPRWLLTSR